MSRRNPTPVNIRNFSVKCGRCGEYQVVVAFEPGEESNSYLYECEWPPCNEEEHRSRTVLEVPLDLDEFANRDPKWHGGKVHAGADARAEEDEAAREDTAEEDTAEEANHAAASGTSGLLPVIKSD